MIQFGGGGNQKNRNDLPLNRLFQIEPEQPSGIYNHPHPF